MYFLFPYRTTIAINSTARQAVLDRLAQQEVQINIRGQQAETWDMQRKGDATEWLAPVAALHWKASHELSIHLRPKRWLRRLLRMEFLMLLSLLGWTLATGRYEVALLVGGVFLINHSFIHIMMHQRFRAWVVWLQQVLET